MIRKEINVHIGEVKMGKGNQVLHSLLGSCVGVGILWANQGIYGLAHCLLAESPRKDYTFGAKYVDQAIHSLIILMKIPQEDFKHVNALVVGGGNMTLPKGTQEQNLIGSLNAKCAVDTLEELKIKIIHQDVGGANGRKMSIYCENGNFEVKKIPRTKFM